MPRDFCLTGASLSVMDTIRNEVRLQKTSRLPRPLGFARMCALLACAIGVLAVPAAASADDEHQPELVRLRHPRRRRELPDGERQLAPALGDVRARAGELRGVLGGPRGLQRQLTGARADRHRGRLHDRGRRRHVRVVRARTVELADDPADGATRRPHERHGERDRQPGDAHAFRSHESQVVRKDVERKRHRRHLGRVDHRGAVGMHQQHPLRHPATRQLRCVALLGRERARRRPARAGRSRARCGARRRSCSARADLDSCRWAAPWGSPCRGTLSIDGSAFSTAYSSSSAGTTSTATPRGGYPGGGGTAGGGPGGGISTSSHAANVRRGRPMLPRPAR